jgi:hypothetical protein
VVVVNRSRIEIDWISRRNMATAICNIWANYMARQLKRRATIKRLAGREDDQASKRN